jgi:hypothetical protein
MCVCVCVCVCFCVCVRACVRACMRVTQPATGDRRALADALQVFKSKCKQLEEQVHVRASTARSI